MQDVQTWTRVVLPFTAVRRRWMFGDQRRRVRRWEWETLLPKLGFFPQIWQMAATVAYPSVYAHGRFGLR